MKIRESTCMLLQTPKSEKPLKVLDISSGCGMLALSLARMGWQVVATEHASYAPNIDRLISENSDFLVLADLWTTSSRMFDLTVTNSLGAGRAVVFFVIRILECRL